MEVSEGVVMWGTLYPHVIDADFFVRLQIVVHDHSACAHNRHFTNFSRLEPTALDTGKTLVPEREGDVCHIFDTWCDMSIALAVYYQREFPEDVKNDRDIMGSKIPGNIDVSLKQAQIEASGINIADLADISGTHNF